MNQKTFKRNTKIVQIILKMVDRNKKNFKEKFMNKNVLNEHKNSFLKNQKIVQACLLTIGLGYLNFF